jgi:hypothetical protein
MHLLALACRPKLASLLVGSLVPLRDLLSDIVEGLLCRRSPWAGFLTWGAGFLVRLRQRAVLLVAPLGEVGHTGRMRSEALKRGRCL